MGPFLTLAAGRFDELHLELEPSGGAAIRRNKTDGTKMGVEVHTKTLLALAEVWEEARCLDITVMERASGKSTVLCAGHCATDEEAVSRIQAFREMLFA
jgi:hypothetical protein